MVSEIGTLEEPVRTFSQFHRQYSLKKRVRNRLRNNVVYSLSFFCSIPQNLNWIRFPYYHHVFDDEREGFVRHLRFMKNHGEFVSMDDAVTMLETDGPLDGRYFCITFDDGYRNCLTNALSILAEYDAPAIIYVPTGYIETASRTDQPIACVRPGAKDVTVEFLTWDECRELARSGMTIGSHTVSHTRLIDLSSEEVERELSQSKAAIEKELGSPCYHFLPPIGYPDVDFNADRDIEIARRLGYRSFATSMRGSAYEKPDPMLLGKDHALANWSTRQLRYFYSR